MIDYASVFTLEKQIDECPQQNNVQQDLKSDSHLPKKFFLFVSMNAL